MIGGHCLDLPKHFYFQTMTNALHAAVVSSLITLSSCTSSDTVTWNYGQYVCRPLPGCMAHGKRRTPRRTVVWCMGWGSSRVTSLSVRQKELKSLPADTLRRLSDLLA